MAKLTYVQGPMGAGKSLEIQKIAYNYSRQGKKAVKFTSVLDDRFEVGKITSRIGQQIDAIPIDENIDVFELVKKEYIDCDCVLVDESQFLKKKTVYELAEIADVLDIPVMAFGLKNTFQNTLFEGSYYLLVLAHKIQEIKTECVFCTNKATMNLRVDGEKPIYDGNEIQIGGDGAYYCVCYSHYKNPPLDKIKNMRKK